jgi:Inositol hexakisphosphate
VAFVPIRLKLCTQDDYVDAYLQVIKNADPLRTSLVFSCGMGAVRTTFAMTAACLVRRRQLMLRGLPDPYATKLLSTPHPSNSASGVNTVSEGDVRFFSANF